MVVDNWRVIRASLAAQEAYWKKQLGGELPVVELPLDYSRPPVQSFIRSSEVVELDSELCSELKKFCTRENATLFITLLAALKILLLRSTGREDVIVGSISFDSLRDIDSAGQEFFANPVALRTDLAGDPDVRELFARVAMTVKHAAENRDYAFEKLVESVAGEEELNRAPIFQLMLILCDVPFCISEAPISETGLAEIGEYTSRCDLVVIASEKEDGLRIACEYDAELFEPTSIRRMLGHFQTLLEGIVVNPDQHLSTLPLLTEAERDQQLLNLQDVQKGYPPDAFIHKRFEAQVERTPNAVAMVFENERLTYQELNCRANQLAHHLQALGVGPEVLVGICMERSLEMVVGILGILKAGGAYVPLDLTYPKERLAYILEDAGAPVLLTQQRLAEGLGIADCGLRIADCEIPTEIRNRHAELAAIRNPVVICLDRDWNNIVRESGENPVNDLTPDNIAYVIYTSGSTGLPKGVLVTHSNVIRLFTMTQPWYQFDEKDVWTLFHSYAFDFSVWELWGALLYGGRLVVVPYWISRSPDAFYDLLSTEKVTVLNQTPSAFRHLIQAEERKPAAQDLALRLIIFGGEALELPSLRPWFERHGDRSPQLVNMYGITETTVHVTYRPITMEDLNTSSGSVIGGPIPDLRVFVLGQNSQLVPFRVPGELHISGAGLARGYLNQPELTALKFVPDPFSNEPGARLYRSGDTARLLPDGDIEYVGRLDHQVKIRGFRIELGEIEAVLGGHPAIRESVVLAQEERPGEKRLVAYLVADRSTELSISELRDFVGEKLPEYMVPSAFMTLDTLPLTPNGKVDRKALPQPEWTRPELESAFEAPRTTAEEMLAGIWTDVLGLDRVGVHDNFFELGGHSLLAIQVVSRVREAFQVEPALRDLFETPTIAGLAERIETVIRANQGLQAPPIERVTREGNLPLSFGQQRLWFLDKLAQGSSFYNISFAIRVGGNLDVAALEWSLKEIARRHEGLRTTFSSVDGQPVQIISDTISLTVPLIDLTELAEGQRDAAARRLAAEKSQSPFDLSHGPLYRATLLRFGAEEHVFLFTMHHIISDGWSIGVLIREFVTLYRAYIEGRPSPLSDLPFQYVDFASWQREWFQGEVLEKQLSYWKKQLEGCPPVLELPSDRPRPAVQTFRGADISMPMPKDLHKAVQNLSRQEGVTLYMTLLAAFQTLLHRYTGQNDICVGSAMAGRTHTETEGMIGFFVNTLVFRTDLGGDPSFRELLRRVRDVMLGAYTHKDLPFERLVEALQPARSTSHSPIFQVAFDLPNIPTQALQLPGLVIQPFKGESSTSKYDMHLFVIEGEDGLTAKVEYSTDLFDASTIRRMLQHFITLLESIVATPEHCVSALPLMTESETDQLLVGWNKTRVDYPAEKRLHRLFEAQVKRTPEAVALVFEEERLTYRELNERANQLAHHIRKLGVGPQVLVGICLERSLEMVVGILGVLKAGGAYVPLDPAYPLERLVFMLEDSQAPVLLTQQLIADRGLRIADFEIPNEIPNEIRNPQSAIRNPLVLCLDMLGERLAKENTGNPVGGAEAEHPAYVIYTSGSTGRPKGVVISHRAIANHMLWLQEHFSLSEEDCTLQKTAFSFDASVSEFFAPLLTGGRLIMARPGGHLDGAYLVRAIAHYGVTYLQLVPSLLRVLLDEPGFGKCESLRRVICAGEALPAELQERFNATVGAELHNFYGPTEAAIDATFWPCERASHRPVVPIGRPLANTQIYLLGADLRPVPVGVPGELHIGGANLAQGYLNRPELTADRFIPNPFSPQPGARLYRTGDLARYMEDGNIEYLGRIDHQVKVRGFRIELGEVEAVLDQHPAIREAVVLAREDRLDDKRLVAYVVQKQDPKQVLAPTISEPPREDNFRKSDQIELWPCVGEYEVYDELLYYAMTKDERRNSSYKAAINRLVKDKVVLDLGTGKDVIWARYCVEAGAKKVYAIEVLEEAYKQAEAYVKELGLQEKIVLIHGDSTKVQLPEKIDVCVSNIIGTIGSSEGVIPILNDAWRLLKNNGVMIPQRCITKIAVVSLPDELLNNLGFPEVAAYYTKKVFNQAGFNFDLRLCLRNFPRSNVISEAGIFEDLDFNSPIETEYRREVGLTIDRSSRFDGFLLWLNLETNAGEMIDTLEHEYSWLPVYLPVFHPGVEVSEGDRIEAVCSVTLSNNNLNPDYRIEGSLIRKSGEVINFDCESFHHKISYKNSPFYQSLFAEDVIRVIDTGRGTELSNGSLRAYLQRHLPEHMIPSAFVMLDALPLTPNGKVNRQALPEPERSRPELEASYVAPRTPMEEKLVEIWSHLLEVDRVGVYDNFFELGGHSLLATQFVSRVRETFGVELSLIRLFETPVIAELAEAISQSQVNGQDKDGSRIERVQRGDKSIEELVAELEQLSYDEVQAVLSGEMKLAADQGIVND